MTNTNNSVEITCGDVPVIHVLVKSIEERETSQTAPAREEECKAVTDHPSRNAMKYHHINNNNYNALVDCQYHHPHQQHGNEEKDDSQCRHEDETWSFPCRNNDTGDIQSLPVVQLPPPPPLGIWAGVRRVKYSPITMVFFMGGIFYLVGILSPPGFSTSGNQHPYSSHDRGIPVLRIPIRRNGYVPPQTYTIVTIGNATVATAGSIDTALTPTRTTPEATTTLQHTQTPPTSPSSKTNNTTPTLSLEMSSSSIPSDSTTTSTTTTNKSLSIVIQLSGEMGNHLSKLAAGISMAIEWQIQTGHSATILLRHQNHPKWVHAANDLRNCFPRLRDYNVSAANTPYFDQQLQRMKQYQVEVRRNQSHRINQTTTSPSSSVLSLYDVLNQAINPPYPASMDVIDETFLWLTDHWEELAQYEQQQQRKHPQSSTTNDTATTTTQDDDVDSFISFPFLYVNYLPGWADILIDRHWEVIRQWLEFDLSEIISSSNPSPCCVVSNRPDPDEIVWHYRNFAHEMPRKARQRGYLEWTPEQMLQYLLPTASRSRKNLSGYSDDEDEEEKKKKYSAMGNSTTTLEDTTIISPTTNDPKFNPSPQKVAIVTRFPSQALAYQDILQQHNIPVRIVQNQTGVQDFCFLLQAPNELVGVLQSTFALWAGLLGTTPRVRMYSLKVDSPLTQSQSPETSKEVPLQWTTPSLRDRFVYEIYPSTRRRA